MSPPASRAPPNWRKGLSGFSQCYPDTGQLYFPGVGEGIRGFCKALRFVWVIHLRQLAFKLVLKFSQEEAGMPVFDKHESLKD